MIAQLQGDYQQAEDRYRASLTILVELGDRAGIARSYGQLGVLHTQQQGPADGVPYTLQALALELEVGRPPATSLFWLSRQRALLGDDAFRSLLDEQLPGQVVASIMEVTQPQDEPPPDDQSAAP
ncbi:hypothetical protein GCM10018980_54370 [Streptomyces capoamus]|uniref:Tetratricopeptide repeat protein n=2 Tax=Streptomyces capoamus TaxID=68183 RepID=A0A919F036_9ACTN|nr:hypothetical protein GCM10018980_54370 [Streptomyces capoamus]